MPQRHRLEELTGYHLSDVFWGAGHVVTDSLDDACVVDINGVLTCVCIASSSNTVKYSIYSRAEERSRLDSLELCARLTSALPFGHMVPVDGAARDGQATLVIEHTDVVLPDETVSDERILRLAESLVSLVRRASDPE